MANVKVFKCPRDSETWEGVIAHLDKLDVKVYREYSPADVSIVLDGRHENPTVLDGRKILVTDEKLWGVAWKMFMTILPAYYEQIICDRSVEKIYDLIGGCSSEVKKS